MDDTMTPIGLRPTDAAVRLVCQINYWPVAGKNLRILQELLFRIERLRRENF